MLTPVSHRHGLQDGAISTQARGCLELMIGKNVTQGRSDLRGRARVQLLRYYTVGGKSGEMVIGYECRKKWIEIVHSSLLGDH